MTLLATPITGASRRAVQCASRVGLFLGLFLGLLATTSACSVPQQGFDGFADDTGAVPTRNSATITGTVLDPTGSPIADAHVVSAPHGFEATTDADGRFELTRLPIGETDLVAAADGFEAATLTGLSLADGDTATVALNLGATPIQDGLVTVSVVDPTGDPLSGAVLTASSGETATAGDDGTVTLSGTAGTTVDLVVSDPDDALWPTTLTDIAVPQTGNLQLSAVLAGRPAADAFPIGSKYCSGCHSDISTAWSQTAHGQALSTELT
ncbi:MAG: hypothetical protein GXP62_20810, partial [Oligoflexia bacterium]|nr:hypothetical protein [Oligoflexia bacterium]